MKEEFKSSFFADDASVFFFFFFFLNGSLKSFETLIRTETQCKKKVSSFANW